MLSQPNGDPRAARLVLTGVSPSTLYFTDTPRRVAGKLSTLSFTSLFSPRVCRPYLVLPSLEPFPQGVTTLEMYTDWVCTDGVYTDVCALGCYRCTLGVYTDVHMFCLGMPQGLCARGLYVFVYIVFWALERMLYMIL